MAVRAFLTSLNYTASNNPEAFTLTAGIHLFDTTAPAQALIAVSVDCPWTLNPAQVKSTLTTQIITDSTGYGFPVNAGDILYPDFSRG